MFTTDRQTIHELQIFEEGKNANSIETLFASGLTPGGKLKLEQLLLYPTDEQTILQQRTKTIGYFMRQKSNLPTNLKHLELIEIYLRLMYESERFSVFNWHLRRIRNKFIPDNRLYICVRGTKAIKTIIEDCQHWTCSKENFPEELKDFREKIKAIITHFERTRALKKRKMSWTEYGQLDYCFRQSKRLKIKELLDLLYELEVLRNVAEIAKKHDFCLPEYINTHSYLNIKGLYHPFLSKPVTNNCSLSSEKPVCFLTGPNMAGKSTYMKAAGVAIYLAHVGFPIPATYMKLSLFHGIFTTINLPDRLDIGYSHYYNEVRRIKQIAEKISELHEVVVIFDELFRGTNVKDAYDASLAVVKALATLHTSIFIISTHLLKVANQLRECKEIDFHCFGITKTKDGECHYTYSLQPGISEERLGMEILNRERVIETILAAKPLPQSKDL